MTVGRSVADIVTHDGVDDVSLKNFRVAVEFGAKRVPVPLAPPYMKSPRVVIGDSASNAADFVV